MGSYDFHAPKPCRPYFYWRCAIKWFQHISDSLDDPFISELLDKFGANGYLVFFGMLEILCREDAFENEIELNIKYISRKLHLYSNSIMNVIRFCQNKNRFEVEFKKDSFVIFCPKLIELRDYKHRKKVKKKATDYPLDKEIDKEIDKESNTNKIQPKSISLIPYKKIIESFNLICVSLPKVINLTDSRKKKINLRNADLSGKWEEFFRKVEESDFLTGRLEIDWKANFDWLITNDKNYLKVLEGNYKNNNKKIIKNYIPSCPTCKKKYKQTEDNDGIIRNVRTCNCTIVY